MKPEKSDVIPDLIRKGFLNRPPKEWYDQHGKPMDRRDYVSASETGYCARKVWYGKFQPEEGAADDRYGFAERGHTSEAWIVDNLRRTSNNWMLMGDQQRSICFGKQSGTPDGVKVEPEGVYVLEFKGIDPRKNIYNLPTSEHLDQCQQNMDLVNQWIEYPVLGCYITYTDASDYERDFSWLIRPDKERQRELKVRAEWIMDAKKALDIPPEGVYNGGCKWCSFKGICAGAVQHSEKTKRDNERIQDVASKLFR